MLSRKSLDVLVRAARRQQRLQLLGGAGGPAQCNEALKTRKAVAAVREQIKGWEHPRSEKSTDNRVQ